MLPFCLPLQYSKNMITLKQLLINFTSTSGFLNFGMIIVIDYFLVAPKFIQSCFKYVSRFCIKRITAKHRPTLTVSVARRGGNPPIGDYLQFFSFFSANRNKLCFFALRSTFNNDVRTKAIVNCPN